MKIKRKSNFILVLIFSLILQIYIIYFAFRYLEKKYIEEKTNRICSNINSEPNPQIRIMLRDACINNKN